MHFSHIFPYKSTPIWHVVANFATSYLGNEDFFLNSVKSCCSHVSKSKIYVKTKNITLNAFLLLIELYFSRYGWAKRNRYIVAMDDTSFLKCTLYEDVFKKVENEKCFRLTKMLCSKYGGTWSITSTLYTQVQEVNVKIAGDEAAYELMNSFAKETKEIVINEFECVR